MAGAATVPQPALNDATCFPSSSDAALTSLSMTPRRVNVIAHSQVVTFATHATDSRAITNLGLTLMSPKLHGVRRYVDARLTLANGTRKDGTWRGTATIPRWTNPGTWTIDTIWVYDSESFSGVSYSPAKQAGSLPFKSGWPRTVQVKATPDIRSPKLTGFTLSARSVNTSTAAKRIKLTAKTTDDLSGVASKIYVNVRPMDSERAVSANATLVRSAGSSRKGTYSGWLVIPRWVGGGRALWELDLYARDHAGNDFDIGSFDLESRGFASTIAVTSRTDRSRPTVTSISYSPTTVDATSRDKRIAVTVKAGDTFAGVGAVTFGFSSPSGYDSGGEDNLSPNVTELTQTSRHIWQGTLTIPRCSDPGTWTAFVELADKGGELRVLLVGRPPGQAPALQAARQGARRHGAWLVGSREGPACEASGRDVRRAHTVDREREPLPGH